jgi:hypothetical protein
MKISRSEPKKKMTRNDIYFMKGEMMLKKQIKVLEDVWNNIKMKREQKIIVDKIISNIIQLKKKIKRNLK